MRRSSDSRWAQELESCVLNAAVNHSLNLDQSDCLGFSSTVSFGPRARILGFQMRRGFDSRWAQELEPCVLHAAVNHPLSLDQL